MNRPRYDHYRELADLNRWRGGMLLAMILILTIGISLVVVASQIKNAAFYVSKDTVQSTTYKVQFK
jgi:hypothetical protein